MIVIFVTFFLERVTKDPLKASCDPSQSPPSNVVLFVIPSKRPKVKQSTKGCRGEQESVLYNLVPILSRLIRTSFLNSAAANIGFRVNKVEQQRSKKFLEIVRFLYSNDLRLL